MSRVASTTAAISLLTVAGMGLGFVGNLVIAVRFGVGPTMDAYVAATTLPVLLSALLTLSLGATFLPVFAEARRRDAREAWKAANTLVNVVALFGIVAGLLGMVFADPLSRLFAPGLAPEVAAQSASLMRWLLPGVALTGAAHLLGSVYNAEGRYLAPAIFKLLSPLCTLAFALALAPSLGVRSLVLATLSGSLLQVVALGAGLVARGIRFSLVLDLRHPAVRRTARLMAPMVLAMFFYRLTPVIERWIASGMAPGSLSTLNYANKLLGALQPALVAGLSVSGFALMARYAADKDRAGMRAVIERGGGALFFLSVPLAILLCAFARPLIAVIFERGSFNAQNTADTARLFSLYVLALPATTVGTVIGNSFYALQDTRTPTLVGVVEIIVYAALCLALRPWLGLASLPVSYALYFYLSAITLAFLLSRRAGFSVPRLFLRPLRDSLAASAIALGVGLSLARLVPGNLWAAACFAVSLPAYFAVQKFVFRSPDAERFLRLIPGYPRAR